MTLAATVLFITKFITKLKKKGPGILGLPLLVSNSPSHSHKEDLEDNTINAIQEKKALRDLVKDCEPAGGVKNQWKELTSLGEGQFGSVVLVEDLTSGLVCARKSIKINRSESQQEEVEIHRKLDHENVIVFFGEKSDDEYIAIYLEYASGGTVHDSIGATGMPEDRARFYFIQLIQRVKYLHSLHIAHRDLKPRNLLLSSADVVKIGDFGLACEFVADEYLTRVCGTPEYAAPEVYKGHYKGEPADLWSCGIILFKLLTARYPWRNAVIADARFQVWSTAIESGVTSKIVKSKYWKKFSQESLSLFKKILAPAPEKRATISSIEENALTRG
ncbi:serine/threonine-protein kinase grp-like [Oratosquilla oratoria]|uniref:serine/threonine-protein kinase grp-like n=1 Tax=Oratosquilla oratoria TaxID=337810 RepID=UPI003F768E8E